MRAIKTPIPDFPPEPAHAMAAARGPWLLDALRHLGHAHQRPRDLVEKALATIELSDTNRWARSTLVRRIDLKGVLLCWVYRLL
jgi:hypothetical protein